MQIFRKLLALRPRHATLLQLLTVCSLRKEDHRPYRPSYDPVGTASSYDKKNRCFRYLRIDRGLKIINK